MREQDPRDGESGPSFPVPPTPFKGVSQSVDAGACFEWLTQGWTMFIAHPGIWLGSSVLLLVCITAISLPPLFGQIALHLLLPVFGAGMLQISRSIAEGKEPQIAELFAGFRHQAGQLVMVGVFFACGVFGIALLAMLLASSGLIGGGMKPLDALNLTERYSRQRPLAESIPLATAVLKAGLLGVPDEKPGKSAGEAEAPVPPPTGD